MTTESATFRQKEALVKSVFNMHANEILHPNILKMCRGKTTFCIVGNGKVLHSLSHIIDSCDIVVRMNNFSKENDKNKVGTKIDWHFMAVADIETSKKWITDEASIITPLECDGVKRENTAKLNDFLPENRRGYTRNLEDLCATDSTRGFYALLLCLKVKQVLNSKTPIYIVGFGGAGHQFDPNWEIGHNNDVEHEIIQKFILSGVVVHLDNPVMTNNWKADMSVALLWSRENNVPI